jgi:putative salt-induced outer membrane protein
MNRYQTANPRPTFPLLEKTMYKQALAVSLLSVITLSAQADKEEQIRPYFDGSSELGLLNTEGNTDTSSLNGKFGIKRYGDLWDTSLKLQALKSKEDGVTSKEKYYAAIQFDRNLDENSYILIHADQDRARFSGFTYQSTVAVGYGYRAIDNDDMALDLEMGPGYRRDKLSENHRIDDEAIARLAMSFSWKLSEGTEFTQTANTELGADNSSLESETALKSQINGSLATKLTYTYQYVDRVPEDNNNVDTVFGVTLVYSF